MKIKRVSKKYIMGDKGYVLKVSPYESCVVVGLNGLVFDKTKHEKRKIDLGKKGLSKFISKISNINLCDCPIDFDTPYVSLGEAGVAQYYMSLIDGVPYLASSKLSEFTPEIEEIIGTRKEIEQIIRKKAYYVLDSFMFKKNIKVPAPQRVIEQQKKYLESSDRFYQNNPTSINYYNSELEYWDFRITHTEQVKAELEQIRRFEQGKEENVSINVNGYNPMYAIRYVDGEVLLDIYYLKAISNELFSLKVLHYTLENKQTFETGIGKKIKRI